MVCRRGYNLSGCARPSAAAGLRVEALDCSPRPCCFFGGQRTVLFDELEHRSDNK